MGNKVKDPCPNVTGKCFNEGCKETMSFIWYGKVEDRKVCKPCYDKANRAKARKRAAVQVENLESDTDAVGDVLCEIVAIYAERHAAALP